MVTILSEGSCLRLPRFRSLGPLGLGLIVNICLLVIGVGRLTNRLVSSIMRRTRRDIQDTIRQLFGQKSLKTLCFNFFKQAREDWHLEGAACSSFAGLRRWAVERPFGLSAEGVASNAPSNQPRSSKRILEARLLSLIAVDHGGG